MIVAPTQDQLQAALRIFLLEVLPDDVDVVAGVINRVPEPKKSRFVTTNPIRYERLRTNVDSAEDVRFTGSFAGTSMTVTAVDFGTLRVGATVFGNGVAANTKVNSQASGAPGQDGVYVVSVSQTLASRMLAAGQRDLEQGAKVTVQLDFHSADNTASDLAQTVATAFRDEYAVEQFAGQSPNYGVVPLYADDPRYVPFTNENQQTEFRWMLEAVLQVNQVVVVPQQYADAAAVDLVDVDASYPP